MHSNVTIKNVSWPHFSWATLYIVEFNKGCYVEPMQGNNVSAAGLQRNHYNNLSNLPAAEVVSHVIVPSVQVLLTSHYL